MPSGRTHDRIGVIASPLLATATTATLLVWQQQPALDALMGGLVLTASHLACTNWLSPDLDLGSSEIAGRWGRLDFIWRPYDLLIPHRHWLSHSGFSAILRLLYLFVALNLICFSIALVMLVMTIVIGLFVSGTASGREFVLWLFATYITFGTGGIGLAMTYPILAFLTLLGAFISDALHSVSDIISTSIKRRRHQKLLAALPPIVRSHRRRAQILAPLKSLSRLRWPQRQRRPRKRYRTSR